MVRGDFFAARGSGRCEGQIPALVHCQKSLGVDVLKGYGGLSAPEVVQLKGQDGGGQWLYRRLLHPNA